MKSFVLPLIVVAQFLCTSLWFVGNVVISDVLTGNDINSSQVGYALVSVQIGFIMGTFLFALYAINDRFSSSKVFMVAALFGALANLVLVVPGISFISVLFVRFITGFCLAGIYPVGMKIASDYYQKGLGKALGLLVGALVLGTAFPHLVSYLSISGSYQTIVYVTSGLALVGGGLIGFGVPDGPFAQRSLNFSTKQISQIFKKPDFRKAAFGYFGHMWELYAFWGFVPVLLLSYNNYNGTNLSVALWSFVAIAIGALSCSIGGFLSLSFGSKKIAFISLLGSGICCLLVPFSFYLAPPLFIVFLVLWGLLVISDSPQFSTLIAKSAPVALKGTALTIVNCIGYTVTIISIQLVQYLTEYTSIQYALLILGIGAVFGLFSLFRLKNEVV
ncbi:MFS transporter [Aquimarina sp. ERC-38]|uniref:MFS transporter n=1 Tax=Aquimarina sp. ERC-38 TaxID=2949996 RepID=UPI002245E20C|nr:MFS transporter [Aquimarina sp. ERC-38]UZO79993.1 MFS transporter [Aquimarina sp. ERC-38]